jgi:hypothetical protein
MKEISDRELQLITRISCWLENNKCKQNMWKIQGGNSMKSDLLKSSQLQLRALLIEAGVCQK